MLTGPPATVDNGAELSQHPVVEVRDADGDVLVAETVTASIASGSGVLGGTTSNPTDDEGQAVFDDLSITGAVGAYTIRFEAGSASAEARESSPKAAGPKCRPTTSVATMLHAPWTIFDAASQPACWRMLEEASERSMDATSRDGGAV